MNKSKLWTLIKYFICIDFYQFLSFKKNLFKKDKRGVAINNILQILIILYITFMVKKFTPYVNSSLLITSTFIFTLLINLTFSFSFIEKNEANNLLLALPISGKTIIEARIFTLFIDNFFPIYFLVIEYLYFIGFYLNKNILYYIFSTLSIIALSFQSALISGIFILLFGMAVKRNTWFKKIIKILYPIFACGVFLAYILIIQNLKDTNIAIISSKIEIYLSKVFFLLRWINKVILFENLNSVIINFFIGIILSIIFFYIFKNIAIRKYIEILKNQENNSNEKNFIKKQKKQGLSSKRKSKFIALFEKELSTILSNTQYLTFTIMQNIPLLAIIFSAFFKLKKSLVSKELVSKEINVLLTSMSTITLILVFLVVGICIAIFTNFSSIISSTVTRETKAFWIIATAPIGINTQILSKMAACNIINLIFLLLILVASLYIYIFNPLFYIFLIVGYLIGIFFMSSLNLIFGILNPNFNFKTSKEALNKSSSTGVFVSSGITALLGLVAYFGMRFGFTLQNILIVEILIVLLFSILAYIIDYKLYKKLIRKL